MVKVAENIAWLFFDKILRMLGGVVVGIWVARYLGPKQFGLMNYAIAFVGIFSVIAGLGLQGVVVRDILNKPRISPILLGSAAVLQIIGGVLAYLIAFVAISLIRPEDVFARIVVEILGITILFKFSEISIFWFESQVSSKYIVWVQNGVFVLFSAIKIILLLNKAEFIFFIWVTTVEAVLSAFLLIGILNIFGLPINKMRVSVKCCIRLLKDGWPLILSSFAVIIYMKIDQIMLGQMIGDDSVGIYSAATRISEVWYFIPLMIMGSVFPTIIKAKKNSEEEYYKKLQMIYDLMVMLGISVAVPMTFLAKPIINFMYGEVYQDAAIVLSIHIWAAIFVFLGVASDKWYLAENKQRIALYRTLLGVALNVILNLLLIPKFNVVGASVSLVLSQVVVSWISDSFQKSTRRIFWMKLSAMNPLRWVYFFRFNLINK